MRFILDNDCNFCNHELESLIYIYDDDWWHTGNKVFNKNNKEMRLMYCKKIRASICKGEW